MSRYAMRERQFLGRGADLHHRAKRKREYEAFVKDDLGAFQYCGDGCYVWARLNIPEDFGGRRAVPADIGHRMLSFSLMTDRMVVADSNYYEERSDAPRRYWPYLYEFYAWANRCAFDSIFAEPDAEVESSVIDALRKGEWVRARLSDRRLRGSLTLAGSLDLSVPPFAIEGLCLAFVEGEFPESPKPCPIKFRTRTSKAAFDRFKSMVVDTSCCCAMVPAAPFKATIYNVGQANMIYVNHLARKKFRFYFDIGRPISLCFPPQGTIERKNLQNNLSYVGLTSPDFIVISHWHFDHAGAAFSLDDLRKKKAVWVLPRKIPANRRWIENLVGYLDRESSIFWVDDGSIAELNNCLVQYNLEFHLGAGTDLNGSGLIANLPSAVFSGDCDYGLWPQDVRSHLPLCDTLVAPHHGADISVAGQKLLRNLAEASFNSYVSVDEANNTYSHPSPSHLALLGQFGRVARTDKMPRSKEVFRC